MVAMGENMNMESEHPPLLLMSYGKWHEKHSIYNTLEDRFRVLDHIPILCNKRVFGSSYGWLVLVDVKLAEDLKGDCCLWNPISMDIIELPRLNRPWGYKKCFLSKPPAEPDCHILFNSIVNQSFCRIGDEEFVELGEKKVDNHYLQLMAIGSFQGKIYGLMDPGRKFVTLHFVGGTLEFRPIMVVDDEPWRLPQLSPQFLRPFYLIESPRSTCGGGGGVELLMVQKIYPSRHSDGGVDFRIFQIDTDRIECTELDSIGNRTIFLSRSEGGSCCCSSGKKIKPNSIYYTDDYGRSVHVFDLEDGSTTSMLPSPAPGYKSITSWVQHKLFHNYIQ